MSQYIDLIRTVLVKVRDIPMNHATFYACFTLALRILLPLLALLLLIRMIYGLVKASPKPELWGYLSLPNGACEPLTHWENIIGRSDTCDILLNYPVVSRQHAAILHSEEDRWMVHDLGSKSGTFVNGTAVESGGSSATYGDVIRLGGVDTLLLPVPDHEVENQKQQSVKPVSPWLSLLLLSLFQGFTALQFFMSVEKEYIILVPGAFVCLSLVMWVYSLSLRMAGRTGFEVETVAFFLSTLSLAITASSAPSAVFKQWCSIVLGIFAFLILGLFLRNIRRVQKIRWLMAAGAIGLLSLSLVAGTVKYGAANWVSIAGFSIQPSELAKICYIFAGSATLERLFHRRNLGLFMVLTGLCLGCLALMSDFGTAAIFFATFLVIAYLRSGDYTTLALVCGGCVFAGLVLVSVKPYILRRFAAWGHVWEQASDGGYQQTRTMSAAASGGLIGVGPGEGWLHNLGAADTDLVFGMLCEEWGLLIALLAVACIVALAIFAVRCCHASRSSFYAISACAATSLLVVQTMLNVLGSVDILPLTGVTFPFVSNGGSSMLASWGLMAFVKAADTRTNASFANITQKSHETTWLGNLMTQEAEEHEKN